MYPTSDVWSVEKTNLLHKLSPTEFTRLKTEGTLLSLEKGASLPMGVDITDIQTVVLLVTGVAKLVTLNVEGKRFSLSLLQTGDFLGALPTFKASEHDPVEFVEAVIPCQVLTIRQSIFQTVLEANPALYTFVLQQVQGKLQQVQQKLSDLLFKDVHARIAQLFLDMMFHYAEPCPYAFGVNKDISLKHHEIAELIGASRPVTSIALGELLKADLIHKHDGFFCLYDLEGLKTVAGLGAKALKNLYPGTPKLLGV